MKKYYLLLFALMMLLESNAQSCIDSSRIDLSTPCPLALIPTCGCDSVAYGNPCEALYYGGVSSYHLGACGSDTLCSANFDILIQSDTIIITNLSTSVDSITWYHYEFGNGDTSNLENPFYTYHSMSDSTFVVCLTMNSLSGCSNTFCRFIHIPLAARDTCFANFSMIDSFNRVQFRDSSLFNPSSIISYDWNFDDGMHSAATNPTHNYADSGIYYPCLTITAIHGFDTCIHTTCSEITISLAPCIYTSIIDTSIYCPNVNPVCGCDSVTYRNACDAYYHNGITKYRSGTCYTDINDISDLNTKLLLSPNPAKDFFTIISTINLPIEFSIYDLAGNLLKEPQIAHQARIDVSSLSQGLYFVKLKVQNEFIYKKLYKN